MNKNNPDPEYIADLEKRLENIQKEKARLQLVNEMIRSFEGVSGLDAVIDRILESSVLLHGGMNLALVYEFDGTWYRKELSGNKQVFHIENDRACTEVLGSRQYYQIVGPGDHATISMSGEVSKTKNRVDAYYPLLSDSNEVSAILVVEGRLIDDPETSSDVSMFFRYAGIIFKNAVMTELNLHRITDEFTQIFDSNIDGILQLNRDLRILRANRRMHELLGYPDGSLSGVNITDIEAASDAVNYIQSLQLHEDKTGEGTLIFTNRDTGKKQHCILSLMPLYAGSGELSGYVLYFKDITELKEVEDDLRESEERFSLAVKGSNDGLWDWNLQTNEIYFSSRWKQLLGYRNSELRNDFSVWEELVDAEGRKESWRQIGEIFRDERDRFEVEFKMKHRDGRWIDILSRAYIMRDRDGKPLRLIGTHVDLTEIRRKEAELVKAKEKAEESEKLKSVFLANMSHEVRTPLNGIIGFSRLMADPALSPDDRKKYSEVVIESSNRLLNVVNDILDFSQLESGQMTITKTENNLKVFFGDLLNFFNSEAEGKGLSLDLVLNYGCPDTAVFDANRIYQVFCNLINNAIKFTESGKISFGCRVKPGKKPEYYVSDTGIGISEDVRARVFDRFYQEDSGLTRAIGGNGLGLSICKKLVELHGGELLLDSEFGKGSEFYFTLE